MSEFSLRKALKQIHLNMVLAVKGAGRHRLKWWLGNLLFEWLRARAEVETNIYNDKRIKVVAQMDVGTTTSHLVFNQIPLNDFTKRIG